ncbi:ABC transporter [Streptomyces sp. AJS327]|nr:ABC transporter [Streptomyces sp. AJS327]
MAVRAVLPPLLRYQTSLLLRSQRWLPPLLLYLAVLAAGVRYGEPLLDSLAYAAAGLLPVTAWLVRICVTHEPEASRDCVAAVAGPATVQLAAVLTALLSALALAVPGTAAVLLLSDPHSTDGRVAVPLLPAAGAGLLAALVCALCGTLAGALCNRPLLRGTGWSVSGGLLASVLLLALGASPANASIRALVTGSDTGTVDVAWLSPPLAAGAAAGAVTLVCVLARRAR